MGGLDDIRQVREEKRVRLESHFGDVYPADIGRTHTIADALDGFRALAVKKRKIKIAGRIRAFRGHGGSTFFDLEEGPSRIQCYAKRDVLSDEPYAMLTELSDIGDIVLIEGSLFLTKQKEKSLLVSHWKPLAKSLRPLPEKWHGLQDIEERSRKRSLDLLMNQEARKRFVTRSAIISQLRIFLEKEDFLEVDTPILQPLYGGALARPFMTHYNALDEDRYLRIAPELYLKRLIVGNMSRVYEIGKNFRNEGIDVSHNPEFTMLEGYMAYEDFASLADLLERMFITVTKKVLGRNTFQHDEKTITVAKPFRRMKFLDAIARYALLPQIGTMSVEDLGLASRQLGLELDPSLSRGKILDEIFKKAVRKHLIEPTMVTHPPLDISPLAKASTEVPGCAERLSIIIGGVEVANAYAELNDPSEQRQRFLEQEKLRAAGDEETGRLDEDYIEMLEYGMPPAAGFGVGVDRVVQLLTNTHNIRDVILFPALRRKDAKE